MKNGPESTAAGIPDDKIDTLIRRMMTAPAAISVTQHARNVLRSFIAAEIDRLQRRGT